MDNGFGGSQKLVEGLRAMVDAYDVVEKRSSGFVPVNESESMEQVAMEAAKLRSEAVYYKRKSADWGFDFFRHFVVPSSAAAVCYFGFMKWRKK